MSDSPVFNNFDLHIGQGMGGVYPVSVHYSPAGETTSPVQVPIVYDDEPMRRWLKHLQEGFNQRDDLLALGQRLAGYLLPSGPVRDLFQRSLGMTDAQKLNLRLRLRISPPELAVLPWEYTYDEGIADFLVLNPRAALVRYHNQPVPPYSITSHTPVPILVLISNPLNTPPLETAKETRNLIEALSGLLDREHVRIDVLFSGAPEEAREVEALVADQTGTRLLPGPASVDALRDALRQEYRVIHYIGHGVFDEEMGGALLLADDQGDGIRVSAQMLARELRGTSVAVVLLNACQSATEGTGRSFMGLAPNLIRAGVPAVVAMQYAIVDSSAVHFSRALYKALADGWPLDAAVTEGRKAISTHIAEDDMDWGIPVLFMRSGDGVLWKEVSEETDEKAMTPESEVGSQTDKRDSGVVIQGERVTIHGSVAGRDILGDWVGGNMARTEIGGDVSDSTVITAGRDVAYTEEGGDELVELFTAFLQELQARPDLPGDEKAQVAAAVEELQATMTSDAPDLGTVQRVRKLLAEQGGWIADRARKLFSNPAVVAVISEATRRLLGG